MKRTLLIIGIFSLSIGIVHAEDPTVVLEQSLKATHDAWAKNEQEYSHRQDEVHSEAVRLRHALCLLGKVQYCLSATKVDVTSFNPEVGQTDSSPCVGANDTDICAMYARGEHPIALSRDLVSKNGPIHLGDNVRLQAADPKCSGTFTVQDVTAAWLKSRADIFSPRASENVGLCRGAYLVKL